MNQIKTMFIMGILVFTPFIFSKSVSAQAPGCDFPRPEAVESCTSNYIQDEIQRRCGGMSADGAEACANGTRQSINNGDYNYNGTPDSEETSGGQNNNFQGTCADGLGSADCGITSYIRLFTNALSAIVGIVIVVMIVVGGIQYSMARDNPQAVQAAKSHITNAVLALVLYLFMFALLQYLVPGGVLNG